MAGFNTIIAILLLVVSGVLALGILGVNIGNWFLVIIIFLVGIGFFFVPLGRRRR